MDQTILDNLLLKRNQQSHSQRVETINVETKEVEVTKKKEKSRWHDKKGYQKRYVPRYGRDPVTGTALNKDGNPRLIGSGMGRHGPRSQEAKDKAKAYWATPEAKAKHSERMKRVREENAASYGKKNK